CVAPFADCDGNADTGCEADLSSDPAHCGACGDSCAGRPCGVSFGLDPNLWQANGNASIAGGIATLVSDTSQVGSVVYKQPLYVTSFDATWKFRFTAVGTKPHGDGMGFFLTTSGGPTALGNGGGGLGMSGLSGLGYEVDIYKNDPCDAG